MRKILILSFVAMFIGSFCSAEDNATATYSSKAFLKDGKIMLENEQGTRPIDYNKRSGYPKFDLEKWDVKEEKLDIVDEALKVYQNKDRPLYQKKVWVYNKQDDTQAILVEYATSDGKDKVVFTPDENFMFFLGLGATGTSIVYGVDLTVNNQFEIGSGSDFNIISCPSKKNYVVVKKTEGEKDNTYYIYNLYGEVQNSLDSIVDIGEIEKNLCY